jgi:hypothetical protein
MKRQELMDILKQVITSFKLEYNPYGDEVVDKEKDLSWLFEDDYDIKGKLPVKIPADYLIGNKYTTDEGEITITKRMIYKHGMGATYTGRKVALDVKDFGFCGNYHKYGDLIISGVEYHSDNNHISLSAFRDADPVVRYSWKMYLSKICSDADKAHGDWEGYENGMAIHRFSEYVDLYATAAYVSLLRVEGAFFLYEGSPVCVPDEKDMLLEVDDDDNVIYVGEVIQTIIDIVK